jgi:hypothetical protein
MVGESAGVTPTSVEGRVLGRGHEFMHEHEHEGMLAVLASWAARRPRSSRARGRISRVFRLKLAVELLKLLYHLRLLCDPSRPFRAHVCAQSQPHTRLLLHLFWSCWMIVTLGRSLLFPTIVHARPWQFMEPF